MLWHKHNGVGCCELLFQLLNSKLKKIKANKLFRPQYEASCGELLVYFGQINQLSLELSRTFGAYQCSRLSVTRDSWKWNYHILPSYAPSLSIWILHYLFPFAAGTTWPFVKSLEFWVRFVLVFFFVWILEKQWYAIVIITRKKIWCTPFRYRTIYNHCCNLLEAMTACCQMCLILIFFLSMRNLIQLCGRLSKIPRTPGQLISQNFWK